jgi:hypothetical protein
LEIGNEAEEEQEGIDPPANSMDQRVHKSGPSRSRT